MDVEVISLRLIDGKNNAGRKHHMIGFLAIRIGDITINDCKAMWDSEDKRYWVAMPSTSYETSMGRKYKNIVVIEKNAMNTIITALIPQIEDWIRINKAAEDNPDGVNVVDPDNDVPF